MKYTIISLAIFCSFLACTDQNVKLDKQLRKEADSIFAASVEGINNEIDSICIAIQDSMIQVRYDSIVKVRKKRIRELSQ